MARAPAARKPKGAGTAGAAKPKLPPGRPKGAKNKNSMAVKDMILAALETAGGAQYLAAQAQKNPGPFMILVGKVLPMQITGANDGPVQVEEVRRVVVVPHNAIDPDS